MWTQPAESRAPVEQGRPNRRFWNRFTRRHGNLLSFSAFVFWGREGAENGPKARACPQFPLAHGYVHRCWPSHVLALCVFFLLWIFAMLANPVRRYTMSQPLCPGRCYCAPQFFGQFKKFVQRTADTVERFGYPAGPELWIPPRGTEMHPRRTEAPGSFLSFVDHLWLRKPSRG